MRNGKGEPQKMLLSQLLAQAGFPAPQQDGEVTVVTSDSRQVVPGALFVCIQGGRTDGHFYAKQAREQGALAVVVSRDTGVDQQFFCQDTRAAYALLCSAFYGNPASRLKLIAVTGTNGKTTITYLLKQLLEQAGKKVGLIGTIQNEVGAAPLPAKHSTPDPGELHALFARMERAGCEYVVLEATSHALDQQRLYGCRFESVIFTNLTQDHLDYHKTMENYYQAKKKAFSLTGRAVINLDDAYGKRLLEELKGLELKTYSTSDTAADFCAKDIRYLEDGVQFELLGEGMLGRVHLKMPGAYSVSNALAAAGCMLSLGFPFSSVVQGLCASGGIRGRMEVLPTDTEFRVVIDYAHSPDGLEQAVSALAQVKQGRLVVLFGCAGERDRGKRKLMAQAVARYADAIIFTSDNPRSEDPLQIIQDAMPGFEGYGTPLKVIPDRFEAILWALEHAKKGDLLLLAGKGHEDYQVLEEGTVYFDEHVIVREMIQILRQEGRLMRGGEDETE